MQPSARFAHNLPHAVPTDPLARLLLAGFRRMGAHGLDDAVTANAFLNRFGRDFRRPLTLARALILELSRGAAGPIAIAPCCCRRMTAEEGVLIGAVARAVDNPGAAALLLADLMGRRDAGAALSAAIALSLALADCGAPLAVD